MTYISMMYVGPFVLHILVNPSTLLYVIMMYVDTLFVILKSGNQGPKESLVRKVMYVLGA